MLWKVGKPNLTPQAEAVHPIPAIPDPVGRQLDCPCGATALLCAPNTEPETAVHLAEAGLSDTKADILDERLSIVWGREWWRRLRGIGGLT